MENAPRRRSITQDELRNESGAVMDAVAAGETPVVTRRGVPVAELGPVGRTGYPTSVELKVAFAVGPDPDRQSLRADVDAYFGEDRIGDAAC